MRFYLGTHMPGWLFREPLRDVPLFISRRQLKPLERKSRWPVALTRWALDSGGFQELSIHGHWTIPASQYVAEVRRCRDEIGSLDWAATQDWMCEPMIREKTGFSTEEHQRRTVASYLELQGLAPDLPWAPVLQGFTTWQYHRCIDMYDRAGVDLRTLPIVGVGSVCRRQGTYEAAGILESIAQQGIRVHGFGVKQSGLKLSAASLTSSDSAAWSYTARRVAIADGTAFTYRLCRSPAATHQNCANCLEWALEWRQSVLDACTPGDTGFALQTEFFGGAPCPI